MGLNMERRNLAEAQRRQSISGWSRARWAREADKPVRICTLGRFTVQADSRPLLQPGSSQQRPLELLQALIAHGGRDVHEDLLSQALWPDAEGDHAHNAFDVTLHRLRRLFRIPDLFLLRDRHLSLNSDLSWVDAWAFEQLVNHSTKLLNRADEPSVARQLARCNERILSLYQGAFLEREACRPWMLTLRERLRSKLHRHIVDAGQLWEERGDLNLALRLYSKGLEIEPLAEILHQRLIRCLHASGRVGDALAAFQRCQQILSDQFQMPPSPATVALFERLRPHA